MKTKQTINTFIKNIVDKNYKEANNELHKVVETKLKERVNTLVSVKKQQ